MTREEAINTLNASDYLWCRPNEKEQIALNMAIEALSTPSDDLISRQWLLDVYGDYIGDNGEPKYHVPLEVVRQNIKDAPSAELVRCKDCRWWQDDHMGTWCGRLSGVRSTNADDYCSWGERREP